MNDKPEIVRMPFPVLEMVIGVGAVGVLTACAPKLKVVGEMVIAGALVMPLPDNATVCGLPATLSPIVRVATR